MVPVLLVYIYSDQAEVYNYETSTTVNFHCVQKG